MGKLAAEEAARKSTPPAFQSAVSTVQAPTADEEAQMRQLMTGVTLDNLDDSVTVQAPPLGQPAQNPFVKPVVEVPVQAPKVDAPAKFLKPDGTVDEEKLKTSSDALGKAIEQKQKTVEEMLAEYKEKEKQFTELGHKAKELKETPPNPTPQPPQAVPSIINQNLPPDQIRQQLLQLQQSDPIAFAVEIARAVAQREAGEMFRPALEVTQKLAERERDSQLRSNIAALAEKDPRVMNPELYSELMAEVNSDPAYFRLKNPLKAAWNEVKERKALGEPSGPAQPSSSPGPTLGRGAPPSVSSLPQPMTQQNLQEKINSLNPFSTEGKELENKLMRELGETAWRG